MTDLAGLTTALADRYQLVRELGAGGMATVWLARELKHDREVALTVLRPELAAMLGRERFLSEIRLTARLDHPHILTLLDSGESAGLLWYTLPFVRGESLRARLDREGQLPVEDALAIARQMAGALEHAHQQGVIHRDIKPENILLHEGEAMLADFGIALAVREAGGSRLTQTGMSLGTPRYMSPEQATAARQLDARTDVYSLGAVLYEMLAGEPPFGGHNAQAVIARVVTEAPTPLRTLRATVPPGVEAAVARALAKASVDRFPSAAAFATALECVDGASAARRPWPRALPAVAALAALLATGWWLSRRPSEAPPAAAAADPDLVRGDQYLAPRTPRALAHAIEVYTEATRRNPWSARAFGRMAQAYALLLDWGWTVDELPQESLLPRGWQAAEQALTLDSTLGEGWLARGNLLRFREPRDLTQAREAQERAVSLAPGNADAHHELGMTLRLLGDDPAASREFRAALAVEPDRPISLLHLAWIEMGRRRYGEATRWLDSALAINPGFFQAYAERAQARLAMHDTAGARTDAMTTAKLRPAGEPLAAENVLVTLAFRSGGPSAARARLETLRPSAPPPHAALVHLVIDWAAALVAAGEHQEAMQVLEATEAPPAHLRLHLIEPKFDPLRGDPRFDALMAGFWVQGAR